MDKPGLVLLGAGGHAHACIDVIEHEGRFQIVGLVGTEKDIGSVHLGYSVRNTDEQLRNLASSCQSALVAVGQITSPDRRIQLYQHGLNCGFQFPTIVSPYARVSPHATLGPGTIVMHGAVVNAGARIGTNCILNTQSIVEHDAEVGDFCHISTAAVVNGNTTVGEGSFIGSGAILREGLELGPDCVVGMGISVRHKLHRGTVLKRGED